MEVLPLGADVDLATAVKESGAARQVRDQLGIGDTDKVVFTGGKLAPAKKTELLLEAIAHIGDMPIHVIVAGEAAAADLEYGRALRQRAAGNPRVHFVGWLGREEIYKHLAAADMAVFPASQSILWQQSIAAGLPLIAGDIGHQDVTYLNLYDNIIVLKNAEIRADRLGLEIAAVLRDDARRQQMSIGARRVAAEQLDWNRLIERTLQFNHAAGVGR
jgi:glycosyltransferase involved in cell wall biosynthesis